MATLDDATHFSPDLEVTRCWTEDHGSPETLLDRELPSLLCTIVKHSNDTLDPKYAMRRAAQELIDTDTNLPTLLRAAWSAKSYRAIRELPVLQAARPASSAQGTSQDDLYRSFKAPYRGTAVDGFVEYLSRNNEAFGFHDNAMYYGKFCSIVQSSGTGKSRLMLELSKKGVVVLYMNLRSTADNSSFPPRDEIPANILTTDLECGPVVYAARCCAFFAAVFTTLTQNLSNHMESELQLDAAKQRWAASMCDVRSQERGNFFRALQKKYTKFFNTMKNGVQVENVQEKIADLSLLEPMPGHNIMISAYAEMVFALAPLLQNNKGCHEPKLVIALDEVHPLSVIIKGYRPSIVLCRAVSLFSAHERSNPPPMWVVFASTTSKVADFAAPRAYSDSSGASVDGTLLYSPHCQLGWDQNADPLDAIAATDVAKAHHIIGYGRPLWKSLKDMLKGVDPMLTFAAKKLCGSEQETDKVLALFGQRFCLNIALGHREAASFVESSVSNHMRVCITTTENRNWTYTTYPSEPLLSCAAAAILHQTSDQSEYLSVLEAKVNNGMVDVGKGGELASRLLWLLAKDLLVRQMHPRTTVIPSLLSPADQWESEFVDCKMIPVHEYFKFLFGEQFWELAGSRAAAAFKDAYVNFSHWVSMDANIWNKDRSDQLSASEWTLRHWHRTSAVQCCRDQPLIDKMIPIFFKPEESSDASHDHSKDLARVSQIFISDKASKDESRLDLDEITRNHESIQCNSSLPWVAILADLGLAEGKLELTADYQEAVISERLAARSEPEGPCLRIYAPAISVETFPFLSERKSLNDTLQAIILREEIWHHPQKVIGSLQAQVQYGTTPTERHMKWEDRLTSPR